MLQGRLRLEAKKASVDVALEPFYWGRSGTGHIWCCLCDRQATQSHLESPTHKRNVNIYEGIWDRNADAQLDDLHRHNVADLLQGRAFFPHEVYRVLRAIESEEKNQLSLASKETCACCFCFGVGASARSTHCHRTARDVLR